MSDSNRSGSNTPKSNRSFMGEESEKVYKVKEYKWENESKNDNESDYMKKENSASSKASESKKSSLINQKSINKKELGSLEEEVKGSGVNKKENEIHLNDEESKGHAEASSSTSKKRVFKQIEKMAAHAKLKEFNIYDYSGFIYTYDNRPENTLENYLEAHSLSKRMKKFVPTNFDLVDYDKELLKKQLDLTTMEVTLTKDSEKAKEYEMEEYYKRSVVRFTNEEGTFRRL